MWVDSKKQPKMVSWQNTKKMQPREDISMKKHPGLELESAHQCQRLAESLSWKGHQMSALLNPLISQMRKWECHLSQSAAELIESQTLWCLVMVTGHEATQLLRISWLFLQLWLAPAPVPDRKLSRTQSSHMCAGFLQPPPPTVSHFPLQSWWEPRVPRRLFYSEAALMQPR